MDPQTALLFLRLLDLVAAAVELAPDLLARKEAYVAQIEVMIREGRGPTDAEMDALLAEGDDITTAIRAERAARRARAGATD